MRFCQCIVLVILRKNPPEKILERWALGRFSEMDGSQVVVAISRATFPVPVQRDATKFDIDAWRV